MDIKIIKVMDRIYCIEEMYYREHCNCYLVVGSERCLLVDTGVGLVDFKPLLKQYVGSKELIALVTHFHFDHFEGSRNFDTILANKINLKNKDVGLKYLHKKDFSQNNGLPDNNFLINEEKFLQIKEGEIIDLGDFKFKVIFTPGHDETSICLFEKEKRILFSGDLIYDGKLYFDFEDSDVSEYANSLKKVLKLEPRIILGGHNRLIKKEIKKIINKKLKQLNA